MALEENDFISGLTGTTQVTGKTIVIPVNTAPLVLEGDKTFRIRLRKDNEFGETISLSPNISLRDISTLESVTANLNIINEGESVSITLVTSNVVDGSKVYFTIDGNTANVDELDISPFQGNVSIFNNIGSIVLTATEDFSSYIDDDESFVVQIRSSSTTGTLVGNSEVISIVDTSNAARFSSLILNRDSSLSDGNIYESESFTIDITTVNGEGLNSGNLYYKVTSNANIIGQTSGKITINNNFGQSDPLIFETNIPEGETRESNITIHVNSINGAMVGSSSLATLNYVSGNVSSKVSFVNNVYPNVTNTIGLATVRFTVDLLNSFDGDTLYYNTTGNANVQSGVFSVTSNVGVIDLVMDDVVETKILNLDVYRNSNLDVLLGTSNSSVQIIPKDEVLVSIQTPEKANIVEGEGLQFNFITNFGITGSKVFYYEIQTNAILQTSVTGQANSLTNLLIIPETNIPAGTTYPIAVTIKEEDEEGSILYSSNEFSVTNYTNQTGLNFVTPVVTNLVANTTSSLGSISFTLTTVGGNTTQSLYTEPNVFSGYNITFTPTSLNANVASDSNTFVYGHSNVGYFTLQVRRQIGSPLLFESNTIFASQIMGSGGTIVTEGELVTHVFTSPGSFSTSKNFSNITLMIVGGGAGGGTRGTRANAAQAWWGGGGGGGGGGVVKYQGTLNSGTHPVSIGGGGAGAPFPAGLATGGGNTSGFGLTALGGGRGGTTGNPAALSQPGGSGGGGWAATFSPLQIFSYPAPSYAQGIQTTSAPIPANSRTFGGGNPGDPGSTPTQYGHGGSAPVPISSIQIPPSYGLSSPLGPSFRRFGVGGLSAPQSPTLVVATAGGANRGQGGQGAYLHPPGNAPSPYPAPAGPGAGGGSGIVIVQYNVLDNQ